MPTPPALPPAFAAGALYDHLLQGALRHFFDRAVLETHSTASESSRGLLTLEPTADPAALTLRSFGTRHVLRVPERQPFTTHEVRLARAIGSVLSARYHAILDPAIMARRSDLFQGAIEDRFVGAFLGGTDYAAANEASRADGIAAAIEVLRVAALSQYENRYISSGVLLLDEERDPGHPGEVPPGAAPGLAYSPRLTAVKAFYRLCDGLRTVFLVDRSGRLLRTVDIGSWARATHANSSGLPVPCAAGYQQHALATLDNRHVCVVLSPSHEIKVFAEGAQVFAFRNAAWHLLDLQAKYVGWVSAVGRAVLAEKVFQAALDLSDARQGALFVVLRNPAEALPSLVAHPDLLQPARDVDARGAVSRQGLLSVLAARDVSGLDGSVLEALASMDGATVLDLDGRVLAAGAILRHPVESTADGLSPEGARTTAALAASRFGPVLKVSEDGMITFYDGAKEWDI
jgi:hypothetical protein